MNKRYSARVGLSAALLILAACGTSVQPDRKAQTDQPLSCEELARRRAVEQYERDAASADQRLGGSIQDSALRRQLVEMDAKARREDVYEECVRLRSPAGAAETN